jgi:chromosomal replication initiation ATPase DnaA
MIGDNEFINNNKLREKIKKELKLELPQLVNYICELYQISNEQFISSKRTENLSEARALTAFLIRTIDSLSLEQLGVYLGRDPSGLSKLANRFEIKSLSDHSKAKLLQDAKDKINIMSGCQA